MTPEGPRDTVGALVSELRRAFVDKGIQTAGLDARLLVGGVLGLDTTALVTCAGNAVGPDEAQAVRMALQARLSGMPVHRILGEREFHGLALKLSVETLEPRPDTETLVEAALPAVRATVVAKGSCRIADLGVGTGAIGLALIAACPQATCLGIDISAGAVATAAENARRLGLSDRYRAVTGNWLENISGRFDVIVSNPPYIPSKDIAELPDEVKLHDPIAALDGGPDGLDAYREIAAQTPSRLEDGGSVLVEIGIGQADDVVRLFSQAGYAPKDIHRDIAGIERVIAFMKSQCSES